MRVWNTVQQHIVNSQIGFAMVWGNGLIDIIELVICFMLFDLYRYRVHKISFSSPGRPERSLGVGRNGRLDRRRLMG
jgi:hypothetical protein